MLLDWGKKRLATATATAGKQQWLRIEGRLLLGSRQAPQRVLLPKELLVQLLLPQEQRGRPVDVGSRLCTRTYTSTYTTTITPNGGRWDTRGSLGQT